VRPLTGVGSATETHPAHALPMSRPPSTTLDMHVVTISTPPRPRPGGDLRVRAADSRSGSPRGRLTHSSDRTHVSLIHHMVRVILAAGLASSDEV
jgi:hypothetical protein